MKDNYTEDKYALPKKDTITQFTAFFDNEFPPTPEDKILPWQSFTRDFESKDLPYPDNLKKAIELVNNSKKKFPYEKLVGPNFQLSVQGVEDALASLNSKKSIRPAIIDK